MIEFFDKLMMTSTSLIFKEKLKIYVFNKLLIKGIQPEIICQDEDSNPIKVSRTHLQYLIEIFCKVKTTEMRNVIFGFIFGIPE